MGGRRAPPPPTPPGKSHPPPPPPRAGAPPPLDEPRQQPADHLGVVAALLHQRAIQSTLADQLPGPREPVRTHRQIPQRLIGAGIEPQADHQRVAAGLLDQPQPGANRDRPVAIAAAARQRQIEVAAGPGTHPPLARMADEPRVIAMRIAMHRGEHHVVALPENPLRAVAVMAVDIQDPHPPGAAQPQPLGRQCRVVQIAMPAGPRRIGVVPRRPGQRIGVPPLRHLISGGNRAGRRRLGRRPGFGGDRAGGVGGVPAELPGHCLGNPRPVGQHLRAGMHIGHHLRPRSVARRPERWPVAQEVQILRRMHLQQRRARRRRRLLNVQLHRPARRQQRLGPVRNLEIALHHPALQEKLRRMRQFHRVPEGFHHVLRKVCTFLGGQTGKFFFFCRKRSKKTFIPLASGAGTIVQPRAKPRMKFFGSFFQKNPFPFCLAGTQLHDPV